MKKSWMPSAAGVLLIVAGVLSLLRRSLMFFVAKLTLSLLTWFSSIIPAAIAAITLPVFITGILVALLAIACGIYTLRRKTWGVTLAGAIAAIFCSLPLGIAAIALVAASKKEIVQPDA